MKKFRIRLIRMIDEKEFDFTGYNTGYINCEIDVEAQTLYQAIMLVEGRFNDKNKYRIDYDNCTMVMNSLFLSE